MNTYAIWCDLAHGAHDLQFIDALDAYLGHLRAEGKIASYRVQRRQFGFGPEVLGEFFIAIETENLTQLESAFLVTAERTGELENLHAQVFSRVRNFRSGLYRDFPDAVRVR